jgi:hypothetical protein
VAGWSFRVPFAAGGLLGFLGRFELYYGPKGDELAQMNCNDGDKGRRTFWLLMAALFPIYVLLFFTIIIRFGFKSLFPILVVIPIHPHILLASASACLSNIHPFGPPVAHEPHTSSYDCSIVSLQPATQSQPSRFAKGYTHFSPCSSRVTLMAVARKSISLGTGPFKRRRVMFTPAFGCWKGHSNLAG